MKRLFLLILLLCPVFLSAGNLPAEKARGIFGAFGVGPRLPLSSFANLTDVGYGLNIELAYTDNESLPFFLFARIGFEQYTGSQSFYEVSAYSNYSVNSVPLIIGLRHYFAPMLQNVFLFMPFVEAAGAFNYYSVLHQFKIGTGRSNFSEDVIKLGASAGVGISMFLMEVLASYNYFESNQFLAFDLKIRLPLYINY
jgi:hypothetical protein